MDKFIKMTDEPKLDIPAQMKITFFLPLLILLVCIGCNTQDKQQTISGTEVEPTSEKEDLVKVLGISNGDSLSAASKRAIEMRYDLGVEWWTKFRQQDLKGVFEFEDGVIRRDPSAVILVDGTYYTYYTKSIGKSHGFHTGDPTKKVFPRTELLGRMKVWLLGEVLRDLMTTGPFLHRKYWPITASIT